MSEEAEGTVEDDEPPQRRPKGLLATATTLEQLPAGLAPTPFHHPEWHAAWLRHMRPAGDAVFVGFERPAAEDGDDQAGEPDRAGWMALDLGPDGARELGDPEVRDYAGPVAAPGREPEVAGLVMDWLAEDFSERALFWGLLAGSPMAVALAAAAEERGWTVTEQEEAVCPGLELPETWDAYLSGLPKHERHELRRKLRRLDATGEVDFSGASTASAVSDGMHAFLEMMRASRPDKEAFLTPATEAFFRDLATRFADLDMTRLSTLSLDRTPVAMTLSFEQDGVVYLYNSGYNPAHAHLSVGLLSKALAIRDAIERAQKRFDLLRGDEEYKRRLGGIPAQVVRLAMTR